MYCCNEDNDSYKKYDFAEEQRTNLEFFRAEQLKEENTYMTARKLVGAKSIRRTCEPIPVPKADEVLIKTAASGVSFAELMLCQHFHGGSLLKRHRLGYEFAGTVVRCGANVRDLSCGSRVAGVLGILEPGACAQYLCLKESRLVAIPRGVNFITAAAAALNYLTAYQLMHRIGRVREGERILVYGAAGGIGTALLDLGSRSHLEMYGAASVKKHATVSRYGAIPIDYRNEDVVSKVRNLTGTGVDAVFDSIGGYTAKRSLAALAPYGRLVSYGFSSVLPAGRLSIPTFCMEWLRMPRFSLAGILLRNQGRGVLPYVLDTHLREDWYREDLLAVLNLIAAGELHPLVGATMPFTEVAKAHTLLANSSVSGKIVLLYPE
jgi:NADPH:quinone reductase-like Zn-dependent oxidoreductase